MESKYIITLNLYLSTTLIFYRHENKHSQCNHFIKIFTFYKITFFLLQCFKLWLKIFDQNFTIAMLSPIEKMQTHILK